jgi:hypothetical protein
MQQLEEAKQATDTCCEKHWTGCTWCRRILCPNCPAPPVSALCGFHAPFARRRFDLAAEVKAFNTCLGPHIPLEVTEKLWIPHQLIGFGSQHRHECFVQEAWYFEYTDEVCLWIQTKYGFHRISWELESYYWAKLLKQAGVARIPKKAASCQP